MKIPYNVLHVAGNVLFAARGGKIHSFNLDNGAHLSTWKHPDVDKLASALQTNANEVEKEKAVSVDTEMAEGENDNEPPAKRQKVQDAKDETKGAEDEAPLEVSTAELSVKTKPEVLEKSKGKTKKNGKGKGKSNISRVPDRPVITHMTSTADGGHLLAISGHDKAIWVFEHDGQGKLAELSRRTMPKRPSSVVIAPDSQIICADKFGDVYSLPFIATEPSTPTAAASPAPAPATSKLASQPAANNLTVHSKRNLRALTNQQRQMELAKGVQDSRKREEPSFDLSLLLGHVSMLTSLLLGESDGRRYILTSDRDEHIRVSRYIPQAYVIETYCFGHDEFISSMTIPSSRGDVLISGGGDQELFVWDWKSGKLLSKTNLLSLAQEIAPDLTKIAVSGLQTLLYPTDSGNLIYVVAICEDIQAIFSWQLTEANTLNHPSVIQLPGKPLSIAIISTKDSPPKIINAIDASDPTKAKSLSIFSLTMNNGKLAVESTALVADDDLEAEEMEVPESEIRSLLYTVENLRKQHTERGEDAGADDEEGGAPEAEVEADAAI
ncbi:hypothetical protein G7046_g4373 [Stylonectria norvegica]|nr:hypothetical protein G7046_g4373 [Stylonectria norvegica]